MSRKRESQGWFPFLLHFLLGSLVGLLFALGLLRARFSGPWIDEGLVFPFLGGASLLVGGLNSKLGDRLWLGRSAVRLSPKKESKKGWMQTAISDGLIIAGGGLVIVAVVLVVVS